MKREEGQQWDCSKQMPREIKNSPSLVRRAGSFLTERKSVAKQRIGRGGEKEATVKGAVNNQAGTPAQFCRTHQDLGLG